MRFISRGRGDFMRFISRGRGNFTRFISRGLGDLMKQTSGRNLDRQRRDFFIHLLNIFMQYCLKKLYTYLEPPSSMFVLRHSPFCMHKSGQVGRPHLAHAEAEAEAVAVATSVIEVSDPNSNDHREKFPLNPQIKSCVTFKYMQLG